MRAPLLWIADRKLFTCDTPKSYALIGDDDGGCRMTDTYENDEDDQRDFWKSLCDEPPVGLLVVFLVALMLYLLAPPG